MNYKIPLFDLNFDEKEEQAALETIQSKWISTGPKTTAFEAKFAESEGGALVTNDDAIAERVKILREKGTDKYSFLTDNQTRGYYEYVDIGMSYVQSNINGAPWHNPTSKAGLDERRTPENCSVLQRRTERH